MSVEDELKRLALKREAAFDWALDALDLDSPDLLLRQMRAYLAEQEVHQFSSGSKLDFKVRMTKRQKGWRITQFMFQPAAP